MSLETVNWISTSDTLPRLFMKCRIHYRVVCVYGVSFGPIKASDIPFPSLCASIQGLSVTLNDQTLAHDDPFSPKNLQGLGWFKCPGLHWQRPLSIKYFQDSSWCVTTIPSFILCLTITFISVSVAPLTHLIRVLCTSGWNVCVLFPLEKSLDFLCQCGPFFSG